MVLEPKREESPIGMDASGHIDSGQVALRQPRQIGQNRLGSLPTARLSILAEQTFQQTFLRLAQTENRPRTRQGFGKAIAKGISSLMNSDVTIPNAARAGKCSDSRYRFTGIGGIGISAESLLKRKPRGISSKEGYGPFRGVIRSVTPNSFSSN